MANLESSQPVRDAVQGMKEGNEKKYTPGSLPPGSFRVETGKRQKEGSPRGIQRRERACGWAAGRRVIKNDRHDWVRGGGGGG